jgi:hypothetical protein
VIKEEFRTETVRALVRVWAETGFVPDWDGRPVLADALQDAGYSNDYILGELRDPEPISRYQIADFTELMPIPERLAGSDWQEAFAFAGEPGAYNSDPKNVPGDAPPRDPPVVDLSPFSRWDVEEVYSADDGENDGPNWVCYGRLQDGRYFFVDAGCDYTGWD